MSLKIFWQPSAFNLDSIGKKTFVSVSDGDTPNIRMNVRMLSIDAAETSTLRMPKAMLPQQFQDLADWIESGRSPVQAVLAEHLLPRLRRTDGQEPFAVHMEQGRQGTEAYKALIETRLKRPSGYYRSMFVRIADQRFDHYGRLLAYVAPHYERDELQAIPRYQRTTFNLDMVAAGWAASFVLYPSIPNEIDLPRLQQEARVAVEQGKGCWADRLNLTGYEYRMCIKLIQLK